MLVIKAECMAGDEISSTCKDARILAERLHCIISFDFNGIDIDAFPNSDPGILAQSYVEENTRRYKEGGKNE